MLIDSHCHINDPLFNKDPKKYVDEANLAGVSIMLVVGYDVPSSKEAVKIAHQFENVYASVGIIPSEIANYKEGDLKEIEKLLSDDKVIAVGEIGLDYYWIKDENLKAKQKELFIAQIELANKYNLPIDIHCREAYEDLLTILKNHKVNKKGIIHCYSSSLEMSKLFIAEGYILGIGGVVTFKNALKLKEVAKHVPSNSYVLETDAPYLTPTPHRGEVNHSKYLNFIAQEIANLKGVDVSDVINETTSNFKRLFSL